MTQKTFDSIIIGKKENVFFFLLSIIFIKRSYFNTQNNICIHKRVIGI